ncbi:MAG: hypothetical protein WCI51_11880 [Lentisphaerota bacterium]
MNDSINIDDFRPVPFYFINTMESSAVSRNAIFESMHKLKSAGFGGCVVFNKPPDGFSEKEYLEQPWFELTRNFAEAGKKFDLQIWLNDGFNFPPGDAAGRIRKIAPWLKQQRFVRDAGGKIQIKEVEWGFPAFEEPESSLLFIELVYERYKTELGEFFGNGITGFFSDADCRRVGPVAGSQTGGGDYYPSSKRFMEIFKERFGYLLEEHIADIMDGCGGQPAEDYWRLSGDMYAQWFSNNFEWCQRNNLKYAFHTSDTGPLPRRECGRSSVFSEGSYLNLARYADYPGTDHELLSLDGGKHFDSRYIVPQAVWGGSDAEAADPQFYATLYDVRAKYTSSAAFVYNKDRAMCEAFAATNWSADFAGLRQIAAWQIMQGINFFIPHAVHHRLHGATKFFAPPDFSEYGSLSCGMKEFNDWLAQMCMYASSGRLVAPVAVLDPSRHMWRHESDGKAFLLACNMLNDMPFGYVIVDENTIIERSDMFKVMVNSKLPLSTRLTEACNASGCQIIGVEEIAGLPEMLGNDVMFDGDGKLQYMRRRLESGREILLAANIVNGKNVSGSICFNGIKTTLELYPGEIVVLGEGLKFFEDSLPSRNVIMLPDEYEVKWDQKNIIPLSRWENAAGNIMTLSTAEDSVFFRWENRQELETPFLLIPENLLKTDMVFLIDGQRPGEGSQCSLFADQYQQFKLACAGTRGCHSIEMRYANVKQIHDWNNIYLAGNFSVEIASSNERACRYRQFYNMELFLPSTVKNYLDVPKRTLKAGSWAEQGYPFYSGKATYSFNCNMPQNFTGGQLVLPEVKSVCSVKINGIDVGKRIFPPYRFKIPKVCGCCCIEIEVWNTLGNMLEEYRVKSGILLPPFIIPD